VAVEQVKGALVYMLCKYECLPLYPTPSTMSASMPEALYPSGAKDDPRDADLLLGTAGAAPGQTASFDRITKRRGGYRIWWRSGASW
jgi:hypothetical protein